MPLMSPQRRGLALALAAALALPGLVTPWLRPRLVSVAENRVLALPPTLPRNALEWRGLPARLDAFVADHFAFREPLIAVWVDLFGTAGVPSAAMAVNGKADHLFLVDGLLRSTGQELEPARAAAYVRFVCETSRRASARGAAVLFAMAPSGATIYPEFAPSLALPLRSPKEYDLVLAGVRACGVRAVDLRPALMAAKPEGWLYRLHDSHWTERGALVGFNEVVAALGRPEWRVDRRAAPWSSSVTLAGDLPRLAGRAATPERVESTAWLDPPASARERPLAGLTSNRDRPVILETAGKAGPTLLIVGDSYTRAYFTSLFARQSGRVAWIGGDQCRFDQRVFDAVKPDVVLIMPVERLARCAPPGVLPAMAAE